MRFRSHSGNCTQYHGGYEPDMMIKQPYADGVNAVYYRGAVPPSSARQARRFEVLSEGRELYNGMDYDTAVQVYRLANRLATATLYVWWQDTRIGIGGEL